MPQVHSTAYDILKSQILPAALTAQPPRMNKSVPHLPCLIPILGGGKNSDTTFMGRNVAIRV